MHWMQHYMYCTVTTAHSAQQSYDASGHTGSEGGEEKLRWRIIDTACPRPDHRSTVDMRVVLQRVSSASVTVGSRPISSIGRGLLVLVGIARDDGPHEAEWMAKKLLSVRLWEEEGVAWKGSVASLQLDLLLVSQFTLHAELKGNKPDFRLAMPPTQAKEYYTSFVALVRKLYRAERVQEGEFGAMMYVSLVNDGPVTLVLDTADKSFERAQAKAARPLSNNAQQQQQQQQQHVHAAPSTAPAAHRVASEDSKAEDP